MPAYEEKKQISSECHLKVVFEAEIRLREETTTDVELAQTFHPEPKRRRRRRREVVLKVRPDVSSSLLCGFVPLLDVGDLQDGHQQLESILDVGSTVGRLRAETILL